MPLSGALAELGAQVCSAVWFCNSASLRLTLGRQDYPLSPCLGLSTYEVKSVWALQRCLQLQHPPAAGSCAHLFLKKGRALQGQSPGLAELRGNRTNELNCTASPLIADYVGKSHKGEAGLHLLAFPLQNPTEFAPSEVGPGCPPAAQHTPTRSFLFIRLPGDLLLCSQYVAGQGPGSGCRQTNLARAMAPRSVSSSWHLLSVPQAAKKFLGTSWSGHGWGLLWKCASKSFCSILCDTTFLPVLSLPLLSLFMSF